MILPRILFSILLSIGILVSTLLPTDLVHAQERPTEPPRRAERTAPQRSITKNISPRKTAETVVEIPADADSYIASKKPNENFGNAALYVGYHLNDFGAERSLLHFDVSGIPENATILEASMRLYLSFATQSDTDDMRIIARRLESAWDENFVTWDTEPTWGNVRAEAFVGPQDGWYEWDLTGIVSGWVNDRIINNGVELIGDERVQQRERAFNARETQSNLYPRLIVRYTEQADTQPPVVNVEPLPTYTPRNFTVRWGGSDQGQAGIAYYEVQYRVNGGAWVNWIQNTTATTADFTGGESGNYYEFRARGVDTAGNVEAWGTAEASTTVDVNLPAAWINSLPFRQNDATIAVSWQGQDIGSGVASYDIRYRLDQGQWFIWLQDTTATSAVFSAPTDGVYQFEARAEDRAGLVEPFTGAVEAEVLVDARAPFIMPQSWLPVVANNNNIAQ